jgi:hypothetical protein
MLGCTHLGQYCFKERLCKIICPTMKSLLSCPLKFRQFKYLLWPPFHAGWLNIPLPCGMFMSEHYRHLVGATMQMCTSEITWSSDVF